MPKFLILTLFPILLTSINCTCKFGTFTDTSLCDTPATSIPYQQYTSASIEPGQWAYFYIPLMGIESNIQLFFKVNGALPDGYLTFQPASYDNLPTDTVYYYSFHVQQGGQEMPPQKRINGIESFNEALMVLGLYNSDSFKTNIEVGYFAQRDDDDENSISVQKLIVGIIVSVSVAAFLLLCIGGYSLLMVRRLNRRNAVAIQNRNRTDIEAQSILRNNNDHLSLEDLQKYFPKKFFKDLENPFQQIGCSVCLEDFVPDASCHQLYCNHIFHETCVEKWLEKHNSCPGCRVPIGKKAIEEFLQKQKEEKKDNEIKLEIKKETGSMVNEKENSNQASA